MATYPVYPATTFTQAVELTIFASNQLHDVINGDALTTVETENGDIPTLRKALVDNFYFKTPISWVEGESSTVFNQLYYFDGTPATSGWYYAPQATLDNPIAMGSTPLDDDNWRLYQTAIQSIPAQVYPWYTEITEALESVSPPYEFDTAIVVLNGVVLTPTRDYTIADNKINFTSTIIPEPDAETPDILFCYIGKVEEGNPDLNYVTYNSLGQQSGASIVGYVNNSLSDTYEIPLDKRIQQQVSLLDFIPEQFHNGIQNYSAIVDLSAYIQKAIDTVSNMGGGTIYCPPGQYYCNVITKKYVVLMGSRGNSVRRTLPWSYSTTASPGVTRFRNFSSDWIIKSETSSQSDTSSRSFGIIGIEFDAKDSINSTGGVRLRGPEFCVKSCSFYGFQDQGLEVSGNIGLIEDVIANECLKNRIRTDYVGTIEISGASDCQIHRVEGNAQVKGLNSITNSAPYLCGIKIAGNNHYVSGLMGEISETGIYISASSVHHKMWGCRADNNVGPGYLINGVMMDTCHSYNNSRTGDGLYSGFEALPGATRIMASNCLAWTDSAPVDGTGQQRLHKYGYDFAVVDYLSLRLKPWLDQCFSYGHSLGWINSPPTYGLQYTPTIGRLSVTSNATTTPNVDGVSVIAINTTSLSQITGLDGGMIGQQVDIYLNASATVTLVNSSSFLVNNFAKNSSKTMEVGRVYKFIKTASGIWREVGDVIRVLSGTTAERPNSAAISGMQYFDTTLNKPIWRNSANTGWVDATGTAV